MIFKSLHKTKQLQFKQSPHKDFLKILHNPVRDKTLVKTIRLLKKSLRMIYLQQRDSIRCSIKSTTHHISALNSKIL